MHVQTKWNVLSINRHHVHLIHYQTQRWQWCAA